MAIDLDEPVTRSDEYLFCIATKGDPSELPLPVTRSEKYQYEIAVNGGGGQPAGIRVGVVTNGDSFPAARYDGSPLQNEDYVTVASTSTFPFTIGSVTFNSARDKAFYVSGEWYLDAGAIQDTDETPVSDPETETLSGAANTQAKANKEVRDYLQGFKKYVHAQLAASSVWEIAHNLDGDVSAYIVYGDDGVIVGGGTLKKIDGNNVTISFSNPISGRCILTK